MRTGFVIFAALAAFIPAHSAWAWGEAGHMYTGAVAERMLTKNALSHVNALLGFKDGQGVSLREAAAWADCLRDVKRVSPSVFDYQPNPQYPSAACGAFDHARMENYISRNWSNCVYASGQACALAFHFVNIPLEAGAYDESLPGANDHDVVQAIEASIAKLQGKPYDGFFKIKDDTEALLLLAHFVGDAHQPLHVGSVYLDKDGHIVDLVRIKAGQAELTYGGNVLKFEAVYQNPKTPGIDYTNLHSAWDHFPDSLKAIPSKQTMAQARALPRTKGPIIDWSTAWATEGILEARGAFSGVSFAPYDKQLRGWPVAFDDQPKYQADKDALQEQRLMMAGARLAQILNTIWP